MVDKRRQLEEAIQVQESLRGTIDDAIIDATISSLQNQLAELDPPEQQRKQATILFMDIAGHTQLTSNLDPEEQMEIIDPIVTRLAARISEFGGHVTRYQGDGFKAVFGLPIAHENDPQNAVRSGLAIQGDAHEIATELESERGLSGFQVRVGVTTGMIFSGGETEGEDTIKGSPVNLAARLESAADPGSVLISRDTYHHVRGLVDVKPVDPIQAKGFPDPVPAFKVIGIKPGAFYRMSRGIDGIDTKMIGRETELKLLKDAFELTRSREHMQLITIIAEAGIGKSRMFYEFENWVGLQPFNVRVIRGRARRSTQRQPYSLLRNLLLRQFDIQDDEPVDVVQRKLHVGLEEGLPGDSQLEMKTFFIGQLIGYGMENDELSEMVTADPQLLRDQALIYLRQYFQGVSDGEIILLLLEDIHWADDSSLELFNQLINHMVNRPIMVLISTRPTLNEHLIQLGKELDFQIRLDLQPLSDLDSRHLINQILQRVEQLPDNLEKRLIENAAGNPFYIEELIKVLIDQGLISNGDNTWKISWGQLNKIQVPQTLTGVLQARLDLLHKREREILQQASVIGRIFWDLLLEYMQQTGQDLSIHQLIVDNLQSLQTREMIFQRESSSIKEAVEYIFKHDLLREVTYESVLLSSRRLYHSLAADWLSERAGKRIDELSGLIADHLEAAGREHQALDYLELAGEFSAARYANEEALSYFNRAIELEIEILNEKKWQLHKSRERIFDLLGRREEQFADLRVLEHLANEMSDPEKLAEVALRLVNYGEATRNYPHELEKAQLVVNLAEKHNNRKLEGQGYLALGKVISFQGGNREMVVELFSNARQIFNEVGNVRLEGHAHRALGFILFQMEDFVNSELHCREALRLARACNDRRAEGYALTNLANTLNTQGKLDESREILEKSLSLSRNIGSRRGEAYALGSLAGIDTSLGYYARAKENRLESLEVIREVGDQRVEVTDLRALGILSSYLSDFDQAIFYLHQAKTLSESIGDLGLEDVLDGFCEVYSALGDYKTAVEYGWLSIQLQETMHEENISTTSRAYLAEALVGEGNFSEARQQIEMVQAHMNLANGLVGEDDPTKIYWIGVKVLEGIGDPKSKEVLDIGYHVMMKMANNIKDETDRRSFLDNVTWHRELIKFWGLEEFPG